jgi:aerobic carbon-monoxide dehydrogenase small subunit
MKRSIKITVNNQEHILKADVHRTLLEVLRDDLGLTGTKYGCGNGECGACTVLMEGKPISSCLMLAVSADGKKITTIEGLEQSGILHPLQESFIKLGAVECGFCTPGMILTAKALLDENPDPSEEEINQYLRGNLCRCTGYAKIVEAVKDAARTINGVKVDA